FQRRIAVSCRTGVCRVRRAQRRTQLVDASHDALPARRFCFICKGRRFHATQQPEHFVTLAFTHDGTCSVRARRSINSFLPRDSREYVAVMLKFSIRAISGSSSSLTSRNTRTSALSG